MRDKISELLKAGKSEILLDLGKVSYIDSSAICELVAALTSVKNRGRQLKLLNLTKKVEGLLQLCKREGGVPLIEISCYWDGGLHIDLDGAFYRRNCENRNLRPS